MYAGDKDVDRLSVDLSVKDLEKLVRKISSLSKKDTVPSCCRVTPYSATNALPQVIYFSLSVCSLTSFFLIFVLLFLRLLLLIQIPVDTFSILSRTTKLRRLFLPFPKVEKSKNGLLSPTTTRVLLDLRVKPRVLKNPWVPLKKNMNPRLPHRHTPSPPLFLQGTRERGTKLPIPAPPKPAHLLPKKLFLMLKGQLSILMKMLLSARKSLLLYVVLFSIILSFVSYLVALFFVVAKKMKIHLLTRLLERARPVL